MKNQDQIHPAAGINVEGIRLTAKAIEMLKYIQDAETNGMLMENTISMNRHLVVQLGMDNRDTLYIEHL